MAKDGKTKEGLDCPDCGCMDSSVERTRHRRYTFKGAVVSKTIRWRRCRNCDRVFRTLERCV